MIDRLSPLGVLRQLLAFWRKELLALVRDWHGLVVLFLMPAAFILVMSLALRDTIRPDALPQVPVALVVQDQNPGTLQLAQALRRENQAWRVVSSGPTLDPLRAPLKRGELRAAIVLPAGLPDRLMSGEGDALELWLDPATLPLQRLAIEAQLAAKLGEAQAKIGLKTLQLDGTLNSAEDVTLPPAPRIKTRFVAEQGRQPNAVEQSVPAYLVFAVFFVVIPISTVLIAERQHGTLARLKTQRIAPLLILLGKLVPYFIINQIQIVLMLLLGHYVVPLAGGDSLNLDVDWRALALIGSALSLAAVGWALFVASLCKTTEQATILGGVGNILAAALGGIMVPAFIMPPFMQTIAAFSPMNWGLEGYLHVFLRAGDIGSVLPYSVRLAVFGLLALAAASLWNSRVHSYR